MYAQTHGHTPRHVHRSTQRGTCTHAHTHSLQAAKPRGRNLYPSARNTFLHEPSADAIQSSPGHFSANPFASQRPQPTCSFPQGPRSSPQCCPFCSQPDALPGVTPRHLSSDAHRPFEKLASSGFTNSSLLLLSDEADTAWSCFSPSFHLPDS